MGKIQHSHQSHTKMTLIIPLVIIFILFSILFSISPNRQREINMLKSKLGANFNKLYHRNGTAFIIYDCNNPTYFGLTGPVRIGNDAFGYPRWSGICNQQENIWRSRIGKSHDYLTYETGGTRSVGIQVYDFVVDEIKSQNACKEYFTFMGHPFYKSVPNFNEPKECKSV